MAAAAHSAIATVLNLVNLALVDSTASSGRVRRATAEVLGPRRPDCFVGMASLVQTKCCLERAFVARAVALKLVTELPSAPDLETLTPAETAVPARHSHPDYQVAIESAVVGSRARTGVSDSAMANLEHSSLERAVLRLIWAGLIVLQTLER